MYTLPNDAPDRLVVLLKYWQNTADHHPPTQHDLSFDELVDEHPGMMLIELVRSDDRGLDLKHVRVGPAHFRHTGQQLEGKLYSQTLYPKVLDRMIAVYQAVLETGEPHYWQRINGVFGAPPVEFSRLLLPLYDDEGNAHCLIGSWVWKDDEAVTAS
ncbi:MAG: hypothetical protein HKN11_02475 [Rhizobiales bacterium]|nr:hypothetical protein [Hyphomicrobiales bacterium]